METFSHFRSKIIHYVLRDDFIFYQTIIVFQISECWVEVSSQQERKILAIIRYQFKYSRYFIPEQVTQQI